MSQYTAECVIAFFVALVFIALISAIAIGSTLAGQRNAESRNLCIESGGTWTQDEQSCVIPK